MWRGVKLPAQSGLLGAARKQRLFRGIYKFCDAISLDKSRGRSCQLELPPQMAPLCIIQACRGP
eukprot:8974068-Pyramimonas_sp.AAC.1